MSSKSNSINEKWKDLNTGSKAVILSTILISLILVAIFITIMIASTRASSVMAQIAGTTYCLIRSFFTIYSLFRSEYILFHISKLSGKQYVVIATPAFSQFGDFQMPMPAAGNDQPQSPLGYSGGGGDFDNVAVEAHNAARRQVLNGRVPNQPRASRMPDLVYDSTLAAHAASWSTRCQLGHSRDSNYGENIYYNTLNPRDKIFHMKQAVQNWFDEYKQFRYPNSCAGDCGHYTQVVWANSKKVGCGFTTCNGIAGWIGSTAVMLVCNYDPPGNFNNQPPYQT